MKKRISIVTPCYNESDNVAELIERVGTVMSSFPHLDYEHIFIDNDSGDDTVEKIRRIAITDPHVRLIVNNRNFGHIRSPLHAMLQADGDAVIAMVADLQDPPEMIARFIDHWQSGSKVVIGVKPSSNETPLMFLLRRSYYRLVGKIADIPLIENYTGFGLYDREVVNRIRALDDPYPYFRGLIAEFGYPRVEIPFEQPRRVRGVTKNNFYTLYDTAMLGITSHSKLPLRLAAMCGFALSLLSLLIAFGYGVAKLLYWDSFSLGIAPLIIGLFFFGSVQLFFIGLLGEYIGAIHTHVLKRPLVVEKERFNFPPPDVRA
jgi:polyisoprenyl-phosphate glycosyltransferase